MSHPIEQRLRTLLEAAFQPTHLAIENESHRHSVPPGSETHFKVVLVSGAMEGLRPVQRHQRIYQAVAELMNQPIHALALHVFTPAEWQSGGVVPPSPNCLGGSKGDRA